MIKLIYLVGLLLSCNILSQTTGNRTVTVTLPVVTLMDVEPAGTISLNYTAPPEAGNAVAVPTANTTKWINYTSAITAFGVSKRITVSINQVIPGTDIRIQAAAASGGILGSPSSQITLTTTAQTISGIGAAFTGNGVNNGHLVSITLTTNTYANITARTNSPIIITYTITE